MKFYVLILISNNSLNNFYRGIDDSIECNESMNLIPNQLYHQQQQQQQQYTTMSQGNNSSTSPLSTNSYLSSSSSTSSYSPLSTQTTSTTQNNNQQQSQQQQQLTQNLNQQQPQIQQQIANSTGSALYMTTTGPNGSPLLLSIPNGGSVQTNGTNGQQIVYDPTMYTMNTNKPEAKKVKIQKSQPSKVVHIRNIPP